jgi:hypothetical protein
MRTKTSHIITGLAVVIGILAVAACSNPLVSEAPAKSSGGNLNIKVAWPVANTSPVYSKYQVPLVKDKTQMASARTASKAIGLSVYSIYIVVYDSTNGYWSNTIYYPTTTATFGSAGQLIPAGSANVTAWAYDSSSGLMGYGSATGTVPANGQQVSIPVVLEDRFNYWYNNHAFSNAVNVATNQVYNDFSINDLEDENTEEDWYYFYPTAGQSYTIDTTGGTGSGNGSYNYFDNIVEVYAYNGSYLTGGNGTQISDVVTFTATSSNAYYIRVRSAGGVLTSATTGNYALYIGGTSVSKLLINTVHAYDNMYPGFGGNWVEFFNPSSANTINLDNYIIYLNGYYYGVLPNYSLGPLQRVRVVDYGTYIPSTSPDWVAAGFYFPSWAYYYAQSGSVELVDYSTYSPVDYVSWGTSGYNPSYNTFTHYNSFYLDGTIYGYAVMRVWDSSTQLPVDTDDASDFRVGPYAGEPSTYNIGQTAYYYSYTTKTPAAIQGHLNSGDYHWYVIYNSTGVTQTVDFVTYRPAGGTSVDTFIELYDSSRASNAPSGSRRTYSLAYNDDSGEGLYSHMSYSLQGWGVYYIRVHAYNVSYSGDYTLMIYGAPGVTTFADGSYTPVTVQ